MAPGKHLNRRRGALAAVVARLRRRPEPPPAPEPEPEFEDEPWDDLAEEDVIELREELRAELDKLAGGDIKASRTRRESTSPPG
jgi:hypothetical protein